MVIITEQITIKLNKEKFEKIFEDLMKCASLVGTRSELTGKCLWYLHSFVHKKIPEFGGKTHFEYMLECRKITHEQFLLEVGKKYMAFQKTGKP